MRRVVAFGWPLRALWCEARRLLARRGGSIDNVAGTGYIDPGLPPWPGDFRRVLPLRPIWSGIAVNTLLYAAVLALLIRGPLALRRFLRVQRGACPACGYAAGVSSVCPECGAKLPLPDTL